jgi:hypothetical protein
MVNKKALLKKIEKGWMELQDFLQSLSEAELSEAKDKAEWAIKDHLIHMAVWEDGIEALLQKQSRHERMGLSAEQWKNLNIDEINALIFAAHKDKSWAEIRQICHETHQRFVETIAALSDEALNESYGYFDTSSERKQPVVNWIRADSYKHYAEHLPWMQTILESYRMGKEN